MFETLATERNAARFRRAALAPAAAFVITQIYFGSYRLAFHPFLFYTVVAVLLAGTVVGGIAVVRVFRSAGLRNDAIGWGVLAAAAVLVSARLLLLLTFPWL